VAVYVSHRPTHSGGASPPCAPHGAHVPCFTSCHTGIPGPSYKSRPPTAPRKLSVLPSQQLSQAVLWSAIHSCSRYTRTYALRVAIASPSLSQTFQQRHPKHAQAQAQLRAHSLEHRYQSLQQCKRLLRAVGRRILSAA
jgi:hypothetical protein